MVMHWTLQAVAFIIAWSGSWKIGAQFPRITGLPMIVGYMLVGFCCGSYMTGMLNAVVSFKHDFSVPGIVANITLAFIAFSAGSEMHIPSLGRGQLKAIAWQIACMGLLMVVVGTPIIFYAQVLMSEDLFGEALQCRWAAALMLAFVQWAGSVIEVLAIYHETQGSGPVTQLMIGTTMLLDITVLLFFAVGQNVVVGSCPLEGVSSSVLTSVISIFGSLLLWLVFGVAMGMLLGIIVKIPPLFYGTWDDYNDYWNLVRPGLVLVTGWMSYYGMVKLNGALEHGLIPGCELLRLDPLLVCMIGALFTNHVSPKRDGFREILHDLAPLVMPPFFTMAGATLDLDSIVEHATAVPVLFIIRFAALALGSRMASQVSGHSAKVKANLWKTLQSQSGVTLGLVAQMQVGLVGRQPWAKGAAAIVTGCVVMNQLVGPTLCRFGIRDAGESHEERLAQELDSGAEPQRRGRCATAATVHFAAVAARRRSSLASTMSTIKSRRPTASALTFMGQDDDISEIVRKRATISMVAPDLEEEFKDMEIEDDAQFTQAAETEGTDGPDGPNADDSSSDSSP